MNNLLGSHTKKDLRELQALSLEDKITIARVRIQEWYEHHDGAVYVSFSGGKDSTVLLHLVRSIYPDVPAVFYDTGLEYPEVRDFVRRHENVQFFKPKYDFRTIILKYGYPLLTKEYSQRIFELRHYNLSEERRRKYLTGEKEPGAVRSKYRLPEKWQKLLTAPFEVCHKCCYFMKKSPAKKYFRNNKRYPYIGLMAQESALRETSYIRYGCNAYENRAPSSRPLMTWTEQDVLNYIVQHDLAIPEIYGDIRKDEAGKFHTTGVERVGCMFCGFGAHREKSPNRFEKMKITHPKIYDYCMRPLSEGGLGMAEVLDYIGVVH